jgi:hypothetical protein
MGQALTPREQAALRWLHQWARGRLTAHKRRRKYLAPGPYADEELAALGALVSLERACGLLLGDAGTQAPQAPQAPGPPP